MLEAGTKIGAYRIDRRLGEGGMGEVYAAFDETAETAVALKVLSSDAEKDKEAVGRFKREASALQAFKDHPGVVKVLDFDRTADGVVYLVMELLEGQTLAEWIRNQREPIVLEDALTIARQIAETMADVHDADVIHRDLKPGNVMLVSDEKERLGIRPKIVDFGIAKVHVLTGDDEQATTLPKTRGFIGTPRYAAPEQAMPGKANTDKIDVYALGLILYEMLAGKRLFESEDGFEEIYKRHNIEPGMLSELLPEVPRGLVELIGAMLAKKPEDRPTMRACAERLARGWTGDEVGPTRKTHSLLKRVTHRIRLKTLLRVLLMLMAIVIAMFAFNAGMAWQRKKVIHQFHEGYMAQDWDYRWHIGKSLERKVTLAGHYTMLLDHAKEEPSAARGPIVETMFHQGDWERAYGTMDAAYEYVVRAHRLIDEGKEEDSSSDEMRQLEAMYYSKHGKLLLMEEKWNGAHSEFMRSVDLFRSLQDELPDIDPSLATSLVEVGDAHVLSNRAGEAIDWYGRGIALRRKEASVGASYEKALLADALSRQGIAFLESGRIADARNVLDEAFRLHEPIAKKEMDHVYIQAVLLRIQLGLARIDDEQRDTRRAHESYELIAKKARALLEGDSEHKDFALLLIDALTGLEKVALHLNDAALENMSRDERCRIARKFVGKDRRDKRFDLKKCG